MLRSTHGAYVANREATRHMAKQCFDRQSGPTDVLCGRDGAKANFRGKEGGKSNKERATFETMYFGVKIIARVTLRVTSTRHD